MLVVLEESHPVITRQKQQCWGCGEIFPAKSKMYTSTWVHDDCYRLWSCPVCSTVLSHPDRDDVYDDDNDGMIELHSLETSNPELWASIDAKEAEATWVKDYREYRTELKERRAGSEADRYVGATLKQSNPKQYWALEFNRERLRPDYFSECSDGELWAWEQLRDTYVERMMAKV